MLDCERGVVFPGTSVQSNRKLHGLGKRKSPKSINNHDESSNSPFTSAARMSHPAFNRNQSSHGSNRTTLCLDIKRKRTESTKRSIINEDRQQRHKNVFIDDDDDVFPSAQHLIQSRISDSEKNESRMQLGCKIAAHYLGSNLSSEHLSSYLTNCIQLNTANKINKNNAFSLQLIDYMCVLLERNDKTINDFPTMSCSLDASSKIYACRVDCVHSGVMEIVTGLASVIEKSKRNKTNDGIDSSDERSQEEVVNNLEKRSKKCKRKNVISASLEDISRKSIEIGHWMQRPALQPDFTSLISYASITQGKKSCLSLLQSDVPLVPEQKNKQPACESNCYSIQFDMSESCNVLDSDLAEYELYGDECDNNNHLPINYVASVQLDQNVDSTLSNQNSNEEEVEGMADVLDFEESTINEEQQSLHNDANDSDSSEDDEEIKLEKIVEAAQCKMKIRHQDTLSLVNAKALQAADESIYTYFDSDLLPDLWTGPEHWKPRFRRRKPARMVKKTTEKTKNTKNALLSFDDLSDVDLEFDKKEGQTMLEQRVMAKWSESNMMQPLRKNYKIEDLFCSFLRKTLFFKPYLKKEEDVDDVKVEVEYTDVGLLLFEDLENLRGKNDYESAHDNYSECNEPLSPGAKDPETAEEEQTYFETNFNKEHYLVKRPNIVQPDRITYVTVPKKLDMKLLKNKVWKLLDFDAEEKNQSLVEKPCIANNHRKILFSNIYKQLPNHLPDDMWNDTSPALVFLAILHLANEKTLKLKSANFNMTDIQVEKDYLKGSDGQEGKSML